MIRFIIFSLWSGENQLSGQRLPLHQLTVRRRVKANKRPLMKRTDCAPIRSDRSQLAWFTLWINKLSSSAAPAGTNRSLSADPAPCNTVKSVIHSKPNVEMFTNVYTISTRREYSKETFSCRDWWNGASRDRRKPMKSLSIIVASLSDSVQRARHLESKLWQIQFKGFLWLNFAYLIGQRAL